MAKGTELAIVKPADYAILKADAEHMAGVLRENLGGGQMSQWDLDKIICPAGGALSFQVPGLEGDHSATELRGVVVGYQDGRSFYRAGMEETGGGTPPDCSSDDGIKGRGNPGGECAKCPNAEWGTARGGQSRGQACKQKRFLYLLMPESMLPIVIGVPPSSLPDARKYFLRLAAVGVKFSECVTSIKLERDKNSAGIAYSKYVFTMGEKLDPESAAKMAKIKDAMSAAISRAS